MNFFVHTFALSLLIFSPLLFGFDTKDSNLGENIEEQRSQNPLFVSLGSTCTTARMQRECGIRKAAFPFDWIVSLDGEKLIEILEENFLHFLNPDVLEVSGHSLLNHYYRLEFLNEGDWEDAAYNIKIFSEKCQRRITRFIQLRNYQGKVFFVRTAYPYSLSDPHRVWKIKENLEITPEYGEKLHKALKKFFPELDFELIVINGRCEEGFSVEKLSQGILMVNIDISMVNIDTIIASYKGFYSKLLTGDLGF